MNSHHNTLGLFDQPLKEAEKKAKTQEDKVLEIFRYIRYECPDGITPTKAHLHYCFAWSATPLTSIRRAITNLTKAGKLEKTTEKAPGKYGMDNFKWKLK